jgi:hypothetical protein
MKRRKFLQILFGGLAAVPLSITAKLLPGRRLLIQQSALAGFQYHQGEAVWPKLSVFDPLQLVREPSNRFDKQAVRVEWRGQKLGYLPRTENTAVAQMLDRGERLTANIVQLELSDSPWQRVRLVVQLEI